MKIFHLIMQFLCDLFPAILFFITFKMWGIFAASVSVIAATLLQIAWAAFWYRKINVMLWVNLGIATIFGGTTLVLHNDTFIKWKPTALYWAFSIILMFSQLALDKNLIEAMMSKHIMLPQRVWRQLHSIWIMFFVLLGLVNLFIAHYFSINTWVNFKLFGATSLLLIFIISQSLWLRKYIKEK